MNEHQNLAEGKRFSPLLVLTLARFGRWDEVLNEPLPPTDQLFAEAMFHYARGMSYTAKVDFAAAQTELSALEAIAGDPRTKSLDQPQLPGAKLIVLSQNILAGELAGRRLQNTEMNKHFVTAIQLEEALPYMEPPFWHHPVRQIYGAALLEAGRPMHAKRFIEKT